jgi:tRNA-dihydrouridine synthase A
MNEVAPARATPCVEGSSSGTLEPYLTGPTITKKMCAMKDIDRRMCCAPMMDWTDRHCRYFLRGFSPHVLLYTEMITSAAILRGDRARLLAFDPEEHPVALQLGGSEPQDLAIAARIGEEFGYDEINLNCGCPSDRVSSGSFGACLMHDPELVAECVSAMKAVVRIPVTVKMRIGVVEGKKRETAAAIAEVSEEDVAELHRFVTLVRDAGCEVGIVHARKAVLGGLSPKENREVPPLRYDVVRELKRAFPELPIVVNGGFRDVEGALDALTWCDGVMLGREAYHRPFVLAELGQALQIERPSIAGRLGAGHEETPTPEQMPNREQTASREQMANRGQMPPREPMPTREQLLDRMARYASREIAKGERLSAITRHMLGLYSGEPGAREYRRTLSEGAREASATPDLIRSAAPRSPAAASGP